MNIEVDIALRNIYNQRNPHFEMFKFRDEFPLAAKQNYLPKDASAAKRIDLIQKEGIITRMQHIKEDLTMVEYMRNNNLLKPSEVNNPEAAILRFREMISIHPERDLEKALENQRLEEERLRSLRSS